MAKSIVDRLEVVQIDENDGRASLVAVHLQNRPRQLSFEASTVEDVEQAVRFDSGFKLFDLRASCRELSLESGLGPHLQPRPTLSPIAALRLQTRPGNADSTRRLRGVHRETSDARNVSRNLLIEAGRRYRSLDRLLRSLPLLGGRYAQPV